MDPKQQNPAAPASADGNKVMDVMRPQANSVTIDAPQTASPSQPTPISVETAPSLDAAATEAPVSVEPSVPQTEQIAAAPPETDLEKEAMTAADPVAPAEPQDAEKTPPAAKKEHNVPFGIIAVAVAVLVSLSVLAVFAVKKTNLAVTDKPAQTAVSSSAATAAEFDETTKSIDDDMKSLENDTAFSNDELSDAALGL